ncbi:hypothetical protein T01_5215 [Trichinella spiralis]|uniref:Uncharacterized protein n=1 Tax=Trichinella spiralis TaxID=6334 RepID=A0A0V1ASJ9_TRISP|nr:hypothetical protein T01_5215 [Trichinella spiralis]
MLQVLVRVPGQAPIVTSHWAGSSALLPPGLLQFARYYSSPVRLRSRGLVFVSPSSALHARPLDNCLDGLRRFNI